MTGHKGFIGSHFYDSYFKKHEIDTLDILDGVDLCGEFDITSPEKYDLVIHLAAFNGTKFFYEKPYQVALNNTLPTINLLNKFKNSKAKFVFASTCEIFNGAIDKGFYEVPTDEEVPILFDDILNPRWSYSIPKALGENLVANSGLNWLVYRFFNIYGPRQKDHFIPEFLDRMIKGDYVIYGDDYRSFCFVDDAVAIMNKLHTKAENMIVNIGKNEEVLISDVAKILMSLYGVDPNKLLIEGSPVGSVKRRCPNVELMQKITGFRKYTSLEKGLKKVLEDFLC